MNITYRKANVNDAYGIRYVAAYSWLESYEGLLPNSYLKNRIDNITTGLNKTINYIKNNPNYTVCLDDDKIIGICDYDRCNMDKYSSYGRIGALYLLKEYQGMGIGKEMLRIAVEDLINKGYEKIELECLKENKTLSFYEKYGGEVVDTIDYPIDGVGNVLADIVLFEDINMLYDKLLGKNIKKYDRIN